MLVHAATAVEAAHGTAGDGRSAMIMGSVVLRKPIMPMKMALSVCLSITLLLATTKPTSF